MALAESNMMELGTRAPSFKLIDTISDNEIGYEQVKGENGTLVMFICNHCPYVIHVNDGLVALAKDYQDRGIGFVAISSNDVVNYPQDGPELMKSHAATVGYTFPYLYDDSQDVAKAYDAACTPDFYLFDGEDKLYYRGRLDGSRPNSGMPVTGEDLRNAIENILNGREAPVKQYASAGCNIKWKK